jgi:uncharacterized protein
MRAVPYRLTAAEFRGLAEGFGGEGAASVLCASQLTKRRQLLLALALKIRPDEALEVLTAAEAASPSAVAGVLAHPHLDAWAAGCLRRLGDAGDGQQPADELSHLNGLVAAAAIRAGLEFRLSVPTFAGQAILPTLGAATVDAGPAVVTSAGGLIRVAGGGATVVIEPADRATPGWSPRREVPLDAGFSVAVEDLDPYRHCYQWTPTPRLSERQFTRFAALLSGAWEIIEARHRPYAIMVRRCLRSVVPLVCPHPGGSISAASRRTFGAVGVSVPDDPAELALLLIHEVQHMKLGGLLDVTDLYREPPGGGTLYRAPWRLDPRPVGALLQGVYAHAAVTRYWRAERTAARGPRARLAAVEFAHWRTQNATAVTELSAARELTETGREFVSHLRGAVHGQLAERVPADIAEGVAAMGAAQVLRWRLRNWDPGAEEPVRLGRAWSAGPVGGAVPGTLAPPTVRPHPGSVPSGAPGLAGLIRRSLLAGVAGAIADPEASAADRSYLSGDVGQAARRYAAELAKDPHSEDAWIGLALTLSRTRSSTRGPLGELLMSRPDLVRAAFAGGSEELRDRVFDWVQIAAGAAPEAGEPMGQNVVS